MDSIVPILYFAGNVATWLFLMVEDWPDIHGVFSFFWIAGCNEVIALVWPVYWALLRWVA